MSKRSIDQGDQSKRQQRELNNLADSQSVDEVIRAEPEQQSAAATITSTIKRGQRKIYRTLEQDKNAHPKRSGIKSTRGRQYNSDGGSEGDVPEQDDISGHSSSHENSTDQNYLLSTKMGGSLECQTAQGNQGWKQEKPAHPTKSNFDSRNKNKNEAVADRVSRMQAVYRNDVALTCIGAGTAQDFDQLPQRKHI